MSERVEAHGMIAVHPTSVQTDPSLEMLNKVIHGRYYLIYL